MTYCTVHSYMWHHSGFSCEEKDQFYLQISMDTNHKLFVLASSNKFLFYWEISSEWMNDFKWPLLLSNAGAPNCTFSGPERRRVRRTSEWAADPAGPASAEWHVFLSFQPQRRQTLLLYNCKDNYTKTMICWHKSNKNDRGRCHC